MKKGIIGRKVGMTQIFDDAGKVVPVTVIEAGPCVVAQKKCVETDGYAALQLGFEDVKSKHSNKPLEGHFKKNELATKRYLKEFKFDEDKNVGDVIAADIFAEGETVDVTGISKGKGFQGTIKRHNQHRVKMTHGTGPVHRHAGSMGAISDPSRIFKGKGMPGHMGCDTITVQNLVVVKVDAENNLIAIKGAVPGPKGGVLCITDAVKA